jgi:hypothetical protein
VGSSVWLSSPKVKCHLVYHQPIKKIFCNTLKRPWTFHLQVICNSFSFCLQYFALYMALLTTSHYTKDSDSSVSSHVHFLGSLTGFWQNRGH